MTAPDSTPQKLRITPALIAEWTCDAGVRADANGSSAVDIDRIRRRQAYRE